MNINFGGGDSGHVKKIHEFVAHPSAVNCVAISPKTHKVLATGGDDKKVNIWRVGSAASVWSLGGNSTPIERVCFDPEEQFVVSGSRGGAIKVFTLAEGKVSRSLPGHRSNITSLHYHPFGEFIVSGSVDTNVKIWDVRKKSCIQTYKGHDKDITVVRFSPDGRWVASAAKNGSFKLWDLTSGKLLAGLTLPRNVHVTTMCFNPCEFILACATSERVVRLYDLEAIGQQQQQQQSAAHPPPYPGGAEGGSGGGEPHLMGCTTPESGAPVRALCFNPSGDVLLSATADTVRAWTWEDHLLTPANQANAGGGAVGGCGGGGGGLGGVTGFALGGGGGVNPLSPPQKNGANNNSNNSKSPLQRPSTATTVRCVRTVDARWGRVATLSCQDVVGGGSGDGSGGELVAAAIAGNFVSVHCVADLGGIGAGPQQPPILPSAIEAAEAEAEAAANAAAEAAASGAIPARFTGGASPERHRHKQSTRNSGTTTRISVTRRRGDDDGSDGGVYLSGGTDDPLQVHAQTLHSHTRQLPHASHPSAAAQPQQTQDLPSSSSPLADHRHTKFGEYEYDYDDDCYEDDEFEENGADDDDGEGRGKEDEPSTSPSSPEVPPLQLSRTASPLRNGNSSSSAMRRLCDGSISSIGDNDNQNRGGTGGSSVEEVEDSVGWGGEHKSDRFSVSLGRRSLTASAGGRRVGESGEGWFSRKSATMVPVVQDGGDGDDAKEEEKNYGGGRNFEETEAKAVENGQRSAVAGGESKGSSPRSGRREEKSSPPLSPATAYRLSNNSSSGKLSDDGSGDEGGNGGGGGGGGGETKGVAVSPRRNRGCGGTFFQDSEAKPESTNRRSAESAHPHSGGGGGSSGGHGRDENFGWGEGKGERKEGAAATTKATETATDANGVVIDPLVMFGIGAYTPRGVSPVSSRAKRPANNGSKHQRERGTGAVVGRGHVSEKQQQQQQSPRPLSARSGKSTAKGTKAGHQSVGGGGGSGGAGAGRDDVRRGESPRPSSTASSAGVRRPESASRRAEHQQPGTLSAVAPAAAAVAGAGVEDSKMGSSPARYTPRTSTTPRVAEPTSGNGGRSVVADSASSGSRETGLTNARPSSVSRSVASPRLVSHAGGEGEFTPSLLARGGRTILAVTRPSLDDDNNDNSNNPHSQPQLPRRTRVSSPPPSSSSSSPSSSSSSSSSGAQLSADLIDMSMSSTFMETPARTAPPPPPSKPAPPVPSSSSSSSAGGEYPRRPVVSPLVGGRSASRDSGGGDGGRSGGEPESDRNGGGSSSSSNSGGNADLNDDAAMGLLRSGHRPVARALRQRLRHLGEVGEKWRLGEAAAAFEDLLRLRRDEVGAAAAAAHPPLSPTPSPSSSKVANLSPVVSRGVSVDFLSRVDLNGSAHGLSLAECAKTLVLLEDAVVHAEALAARPSAAAVEHGSPGVGASASTAAAALLSALAKRQATVACEKASALVALFGPVIQDVRLGCNRPPGGGVDLPGEERHQRGAACYKALAAIHDGARRTRAALGKGSSGAGSPFEAALADFSQKFDRAFGVVVS